MSSSTTQPQSNQQTWRHIFAYWWHAIRPKTLLASIAPVMVGIACAYAQGISINWPIGINTLLCAVGLQILANLANDYYDGMEGVDKYRKFGPLRLTQKGLVLPKLMRQVLFVLTLVIVLLSIPLMLRGGLTIMLIGGLAILSAFIYTTSPISFSRHALGEFTAWLFFGPIAVWGSAFLQGDLPREFHILFVSVIPGALAASIMSINNLRDMESDQKVNKVTLAVLVGLPFARFIPVLCLGVAYLFCLIIAIAWSEYFLLPFLTMPLAYAIWNKTLAGPIDQSLNYTLAQAGKLTFLFCLLLAIAFAIYGSSI
jgi:1,4-dihydroxy-2-naphthoate octaprenyltransferase